MCSFRSTGGVTKQYSAEALITAEALKGKFSVRRIAELTGVPRATISDHHRAAGRNAGQGSAPAVATQQVLSVAQENGLVRYVTVMAKRLESLSLEDILHHAYVVAAANPPANLKALEAFRSWEKNEKASEKWWRGFKQRNPEISFCMPNQMETTKRANITQEQLDSFPEQILALMDKEPHLVSEEYWWDTDETPLQAGGRTKKVLTVHGVPPNKKSCPNPKLRITILPCICANGTELPPLFIVKGKLLNIPAGWWGSLAPALAGTVLSKARCVSQARRN